MLSTIDLLAWANEQQQGGREGSVLSSVSTLSFPAFFTSGMNKAV